MKVISMKKMFIVVAIISLLGCETTDSAGGDESATPNQPPVDISQVTLCHHPGTNHEETLSMDMDSAQPHFEHGDPLGQCAAPVPQSVFDPSIDLSNGYHVAEIRDGIYYVTDGIYQVMFLTTGVGVIVVDAPAPMGDKIIDGINDVTNEPVTHIIYTHAHSDHMGGAGRFPGNPTVISHKAVAETLTRNDADQPGFAGFVGGGPVPIPTMANTFEGSLTLNVGNKTLELIDPGPNHSEGNIIVYAPDQKVINFVDVIFPGWTPFRNMALAKDVPGFLKVHDTLLTYDWDILVAGHLTRLGTRQDVINQRDYFMDIRANATTALQTVNFFGIVEQTGFENTWLLFETYFDVVSQTCADLTEPDWIDILGGVDVWTKRHCFTMAESLRIDL